MSVDFNRATGLLILEVVNSNPNGDPDRENDPRQRPNGLGEISPVSVKRKIRDLIEDHDGVFFQSLPEAYIRQADLYCILESRGRDRAAITKEMNDNPNFMDSTFVRKYWDARIFGNTFLEDGGNKEYIKTGAVQFGMGLSISPISIVRHTNTNKAGVEEGLPASIFFPADIRLPSDSTSQWTPLPSANASYCRARCGLSPLSCCSCRAHQKKTAAGVSPCRRCVYAV